jgi:hypothetical protein
MIAAYRKEQTNDRRICNLYPLYRRDGLLAPSMTKTNTKVGGPGFMTKNNVAVLKSEISFVSTFAIGLRRRSFCC